MKTEQDSPVKDKHFLVAVDDSESSKRAVVYVADLLGSLPGFTVTLCSIIPAPEQDFFDREEQGQEWIKEKTAQAGKMLENYRQVLIQSGFSEDKVSIQTFVNEEKSFADAILAMRCDLTCCTVVVGRHHKSKTEEFLFGSTSSKLIHEAKNCAVWVVE
ncbi:MAG: universal stress protein [Nitrospirae bacterium]|nr:universal stress protein [Nitrospirota bacterium]